MDFNYDDEQNALREAVKGLVGKAYSDYEQRRQTCAEDPGFDEKLWASMAEMGLLGLPFSEDDGGVGASPVEIGIVCQELGRVIAPEPYLTSVVLAGGLVAACGSTEQRGEVLGALSAGESVLAFAHDEPGRGWTPSAEAVTASQDGDTWTLTGTKEPVPHGARADVLVVSAALPDGGTGLFLVEGDAPERTGYPTYDGTRAAKVVFDGTAATPLGAGGDVAASISTVQDITRIMAANQALGAEYGDVQISNLIAKGAIKTVNDLLDLELPENFRQIELELDYEVSRHDSGYRAAQRGTAGLQVPAALLATVQPATLCTFEAAGAGTPPLPFRLVSRPQFRLGRARADADFVAWVLPRASANDEKTKRVSKAEAIAAATAAGIVLRDSGSANGTLFDNVPLDEQGTSLPRQGRLLLAGAVEVDFDRLATGFEGELSLANARAWMGPPPVTPVQRGAMRFEVVSSEPQPLNAVWLLSDASFGASRSTAIHLDDPALADVQGRFHHYRGCFWIETLTDNSAVQLDRMTLRPGELAPLATGQQLRIGGQTWRVKLEA